MVPTYDPESIEDPKGISSEEAFADANSDAEVEMGPGVHISGWVALTCNLTHKSSLIYIWLLVAVEEISSAT
jgi:hypothetical protein